MGLALPKILASACAARLAAWLYFLALLAETVRTPLAEAGLWPFVAIVLVKRVPAIAGAALSGRACDRIGEGRLLRASLAGAMALIAIGGSGLAVLAALSFVEALQRAPY